jgi:hypothetical protein
MSFRAVYQSILRKIYYSKLVKMGKFGYKIDEILKNRSPKTKEAHYSNEFFV